MGGTLLVNGLSFVKSLVIAAYYGTSAQLDAFFLSLTPVRLISGVFLGALQATLIPRYLELVQKKGSRYAFGVLGTFLECILAAFLILTAIFWIKSTALASYLGAGFDASRVALTASFLKISTIFLLATMANDISLAIFQAHRQFTFSAFIPLLSGILSLGYIVWFREQGVPSLMYGLIFGMLFQCGVSLYAVRRFFPARPIFISLFDAEIRQTLTILLPLLVGASFGHINVLIDQIMASTLPAGSIAALHYATKLHAMLTQMFILVVSKAALPFFSQQAAEKDFTGMKETFLRTSKIMLSILLPLSLFILIFGKYIIQIVFQRGAFLAHSTQATSAAWSAYTLGLPFQALGILTARMFNALQDNRILMYVSAGSIGLNILFNLIFMKFWGHVGIALSTSGVSCFTTLILFFCLQKKFTQLEKS